VYPSKWDGLKCFFFFFFNSLPLSQVPCGRLIFSFFLWRCGGAPGYFPRPSTPTLSSPQLSFFWTTRKTHTTQHPWEAIRPGIRTLLTSRWCRKSVALPPTTLPSAPAILCFQFGCRS
jgi:hypothetical protein